MLRISYDPAQMRALFICDTGDLNTQWFALLRRTLEDHTRELAAHADTRFSVPWWSFLTARPHVLQVIKAYSVDYKIEDEARILLQVARSRQRSFDEALRATPMPETEVLGRLTAANFKLAERPLTTEQLRNVGRLATLPAAATFSVPGAGKTTEALVYYFLRRNDNDRLLVIAPKNAFTAWEEQLEDCLGGAAGKFVRLRGGAERIASLLSTAPRFMLITYQQLVRVADLIASFITVNPTFVFLDESHRIKSGQRRATADAVLKLSHLPVGKLIMSGTPMPQAVEDLLPQFAYLYPEVVVDATSVVDIVRSIYVRTTKAELGLPEPIRRVIRIEMNEHQARLYNLMKYEVARLAEQSLTAKSRQAFRALGRSIMRLLQFVSNPALLSKEIAFAHEGLLMAVLGEGDSRKIEWALTRARQLAREGKKSIIWTSFRENVEVVAYRLSDLKAVYIHGGVEAGDELDEDTREGRIRLFHDDPNTFVMVANPAAAAEGISLHRVCHNAIYIDRTYNAAHYLQSEDRIHRLGLRPTDQTVVEVLECVGTIDESVRMRLIAKVQEMAQVLNDRSLHIDPIVLDQYEIDDEIEAEADNLQEEDIRSLLKNIQESG